MIYILYYNIYILIPRYIILSEEKKIYVKYQKKKPQDVQAAVGGSMCILCACTCMT